MLDGLFAFPLDFLFSFFFNDTATTEIYTLSLHDALPISRGVDRANRGTPTRGSVGRDRPRTGRSEEHTSELQSHVNLVCRLLLEKKKKNILTHYGDLLAHHAHTLRNTAVRI